MSEPVFDPVFARSADVRWLAAGLVTGSGGRRSRSFGSAGSSSPRTVRAARKQGSQTHGIRNTLWTTWLRRPPASALRRTAWLAGSVPRDRTSAEAVLRALRGLPWVLRERRVVPKKVEANLRLLEAPQRDSSARRYVG
ncbi:MAG TPA: hypothetical protein VFU65_15155 [Actinocrinis sp.]|nr:hypothetical protein [Actinocrinis sp.]